MTRFDSPETPSTDPEFLAVARGDRPAEVLIRGGNVVNVFTGQIDQASVAIYGSRIAGVGDYTQAGRVVDAAGKFVAPGFIDAHMHVESTMMPPSEFVRVASVHGTTGVVLDPHEIANVMGIAGIRFLMDDADGLPMNIMWSASSCVPASPLETSGASIGPGEIAELLDDPRVVALAEMMNFPGVVRAVPEVLEKVRLGLDKRIVDGHCPGLTGTALQAYVAAGISSDHESTTLKEAREKLRLGMRIYIREGSAAKNLEALLPAVSESNKHRFCFCTDDRHPEDLVTEGHINHVVRKAVRLGMNPTTAIALGSIFPAQHYRRRDLGAIAPGYQADIQILPDLKSFRPSQVYFHGRLVAEDWRFLPERSPTSSAHTRSATVSSVHLPSNFNEASLRVPARRTGGRIRVIGMNPQQLVTSEMIVPATVESGRYVPDPRRDILKLAVIERHKGTGNIGLGFVHGFGFQSGALGSTVGHDSHNLAIVGVGDADMAEAARALAQAGGGQCVVRDGRVLALMPLPIAGLISDQPIETIVSQQRALLEASRSIGCEIPDPFMPLSFLPLVVIPKLKLSDLGLVDVDLFERVPIEA